MQKTLSLLFILGIVGSGASYATVVSGRVTSGSGTGIANIDLDFIDRDSGVSIPLVNDNTDILGFYAINVPNGRYDVQFEPAPGIRFAGFEERDVRVEGSPVTLNMQLDTGWFLSGHVTTQTGVPVTGLDLDFFDILDGAVAFVANDKTDVNGNFIVVVAASQYNVEFEPVAGSTLVATNIPGVSVASDINFGTIELQEGVHLRGFVHSPTSTGVSPARVQQIDPLTGLEVFNIRRDTDPTGWYDLLVAPGSYDLLILPPDGSALLPRLVAGVSLAADTTLPPIPLDQGVVASGTVLRPGASPAAQTDLDFIESLSGIERFTPRDNAADNGTYSIPIPPGIHDVNFNPVTGSGLAPHRLPAVSVLANTTLPTVTLQTARNVNGIVKNGAGVALPGVDLDFTVSATGVDILTNDDNTTATGAFTVGVPSGTYDIEFSPAEGSGYGQVTLLNRTVTGAVNLGTVTLPPAFPAAPSVVSPTAGSASGGTLVTVTGSGFEPGVQVRLGGALLTGTVLINANTVQGTTRVHPAGIVDLAVTNPGAATVAVPAAFQYTLPLAGPVLTVDRTGPLGTDIQLQWSSTGSPSYSIFRIDNPANFAQTRGLLNVVAGTSYRDDGAASPVGPNPLLYYWVH